MPELIVTKYEEGNPLLEQYFALRYKAFTSGGMFYYQPGADSHDKQKDTIFIVAHEGGKVLGGRRMLIHEPGSDTHLKTEESTNIPIRDMFPHLGTQNMRYVEFASMCVDPALQGGGISSLLYKKTGEVYRAGNFDFWVTEAVPDNMGRFFKKMGENGASEQAFVLREMLLTPEAVAKQSRMVVSNPDRPFQVSVAKPEAFSPEMQAMRVQNLAYEPLPQGSGIIPPIKATLAHIDGKPMYICAVYSNDGDFDVRAAGSHKSADELPLRSPEMVALGVGEPFNHIQIDKVVETRHVIAESKKRGS